MPTPRQQPSDAEWKVLHALWRRGKATSRELLEELAAENWAYTTLKTMLTRMEEKGFVRSRPLGNAAQYEPLLARGEAQRSALRTLTVRQRAVVFFTYWADLGPSDIAVLMDLSLRTVERDLSVAKTKLGALLS